MNPEIGSLAFVQAQTKIKKDEEITLRSKMSLFSLLDVTCSQIDGLTNVCLATTPKKMQ